MQPEEIRQKAKESANLYYQHLNDFGLALVETKVTRFEVLDEGFVRLYLSGRLNTIDGAQIKILNTLYSEEQIALVRYDRYRKILTVKVRKDCASAFYDVSSDNVKVVADLKFLVRRVEKWYEDYIEPLNLPDSVPVIPPEMPKLNQTPSEDQLLAYEGVFSSPLTYVWGAPGTGKTQFVLARAVLSYCLAGQKVLIVAPTNNAVEQTLYGVLAVLKEAGIPMDKVIRLGTPSKEFYDLFPGICEVRSVEDEMTALVSEIEYHKRLIAYNGTIAWHDEISARLADCHKRYVSLKESADRLSRSIREDENALHAKKAQFAPISTEIETLSARKMQLLVYVTKSRAKLSAWIKRKKLIAAKAELKETDSRLKQFGTESQDLTDAINELTNRIQLRMAQLSDLENRITSIASELKQMPSCPVPLPAGVQQSDLNSVFASLSSGMDYSGAFSAAESALKSVKRFLDSRSYLYKEIDLDTAQIELEELETRKNGLSVHTVSSRLENCLVAAATVDGYINKLFDSEVFCPVHIFLDEAAYCPLIKGAVLLSAGVPITLLGDHMQLPPVMAAKGGFLKDPQNTSCCLWALSALFIGDLFEATVEDLYSACIADREPMFCHVSKYSLVNSFRFGEDLAAILDRYVYEIGLRGNPNIGTEIYCISVPRVPPNNGRHENEDECKTIQRLLTDKSFSDYAVLAPFRDAVSMLKHGYVDADSVFTIHGSQGREWDDVILSVVETTKNWFLTEKLINTAVSRAKKRLFVICDADYWKMAKDSLIGGLLSVAEPWEL